MTQQTVIKTKNAKSVEINQVLNALLKEMRRLRQSIDFILPQEDINDYANPERIKRSYQKALKKYSPVIWK